MARVLTLLHSPPTIIHQMPYSIALRVGALPPAHRVIILQAYPEIDKLGTLDPPVTRASHRIDEVLTALW